MHDTGRPPLRLGLFWVASSSRSGSWWGLSTIVRVPNLLARLNEFNECLGHHAAVELLEVLQRTLIVTHDLLGVPDAEGNHLR